MSNIGVIGGGVSGVVTSLSTTNNNITILERNDKLLKKLLLTGSGRCNYFNSDTSISHFHSTSHKLSNYINKTNLEKVLDFYNNLGIIPKVVNGYYYPFSNSATTVRDALLYALSKTNTTIKYNYLVNKIDYSNNKFIINNELVFDKLIISTGSYSYPITGSDGVGYNLLESLGHTLITPAPSLVPLTTNFKYMKELKGIRTDVEATLYINNKQVSKEIGQLQLTDYGLSGICIFNLSYYIKDNSSIRINFMPFIKNNPYEWFNIFSNTHSNKNIYNLLSGILNYKLVKVLLKYLGINENTYYKDLSLKEKHNLVESLTNFKFDITGTLDYNHSQVTKGGIPLEEVNNNLESNIVRGLYITGELLDITGDCGGYNLMNATLSGLIVGSDLSDKNKTN